MRPTSLDTNTNAVEILGNLVYDLIDVGMLCRYVGVYGQPTSTYIFPRNQG